MLPSWIQTGQFNLEMHRAALQTGVGGSDSRDRNQGHSHPQVAQGGFLASARAVSSPQGACSGPI